MDEERQERANDKRDGQIDAMISSEAEDIFEEAKERLDGATERIISQLSLRDEMRDSLYNMLCLVLAKKLTDGMS